LLGFLFQFYIVNGVKISFFTTENAEITERIFVLFSVLSVLSVVVKTGNFYPFTV